MWVPFMLIMRNKCLKNILFLHSALWNYLWKDKRCSEARKSLDYKLEKTEKYRESINDKLTRASISKDAQIMALQERLRLHVCILDNEWCFFYSLFCRIFIHFPFLFLFLLFGMCALMIFRTCMYKTLKTHMRERWVKNLQNTRQDLRLLKLIEKKS